MTLLGSVALGTGQELGLGGSKSWIWALCSTSQLTSRCLRALQTPFL